MGQVRDAEAGNGLSPARGLRFARVADDEGFDKLEHEWVALTSASSADPLFCSYPWMRTWWRFYSGLGSLALVTAREADGRLVGIAPLFQRTMRAADLEREMIGDRKPIIPTAGASIRVLQPLGTGEVCSDFLGFIALAGREEEIAGALAAHIRDAGGFDVLDLNHVREDAPGFAAVRRAFDGKTTRLRSHYGAPFAELPEGGFDAYLDTLSKKSRYNARKKIKQIRIHHKLDHVFHEDLATLPEAMETFFALHHERWKAAGEDGVFNKEPMRSFHKAFAAEALRLGWLRLGFLYLDDGPPVFATYAFHAGDAVHLYQQGSVNDYEEFNLGYAALVFSIEDACERGAGRYEFLRGEADYKLHWAKDRHALVQFQAAASIKGKTFFARSFVNTDPNVRAKVKKLLRKG